MKDLPIDQNTRTKIVRVKKNASIVTYPFICFPAGNKILKNFSFKLMKKRKEADMIRIGERMEGDRDMEQKQISETSKKVKRVELEKLADWIKEKYPQDFVLQIEFKNREDSDGKK